MKTIFAKIIIAFFSFFTLMATCLYQWMRKAITWYKKFNFLEYLNTKVW